MKNKELKISSRVLVIAAGLVLFAVLYLPIWRIELSAPQYPEGLVLQIYAAKLGGNVDIINGLNHYIGMKTLHTNDFAEFTVLPYIIAAFGLFFILSGLLNRKKLLYVLLTSFIIFGAVAMIDFWKWDYDYGHNLNPEAAIKVPGMAYQPPLIGYKQLLNFGAYSVPDTGGWIFIGAGILLLLCVVTEWRRAKRYTAIQNFSTKRAVTLVMFVAAIAIISCNVKPEPLQPGKDNCSFCKMTVSDPRFGAEIITNKGKIYKFDDMHCLMSFIKSNTVPTKEIKDVYFVSFNGDHGFIKADEALLLKSDELHSPMNGNVAVFKDAGSLKQTMESLKGIVTNWKGLNAE